MLSIEIEPQKTGKRFYKYNVTYKANGKIINKQVKSLNLLNGIIKEITYNPDITRNTVYDYICYLYEKYFGYAKKDIEIWEDVKTLTSTYKTLNKDILKALEFEVIALQSFISMQLKLLSNGKKDTKPKDRFALIYYEYIEDSLNKLHFDSLARHFIHFTEQEITNIKNAIINPDKAKKPHVTHIEFFLLSLYHTRTHHQIAETNINNKTIISTEFGIFPLIWAEIKYCLENNIYINRCSICDNYYTTDRISSCCYNERCRKILHSMSPSESKEQKSLRNKKDYKKRKGTQ